MTLEDSLEHNRKGGKAVASNSEIEVPKEDMGVSSGDDTGCYAK
jgi:hypothetical protein